MVQHHKGSLFDAPKGSFVGHACNCQGVWGSGIAVEFKKRFKKSWDLYRETCMANLISQTPKRLLGTAYATAERDYGVVCLFTSFDYGKNVDSPEDILESTYLAINDLAMMYPEITELHIPRINSGLFKVPWERTEEILMKAQGITFHVWTP